MKEALYYDKLENGIVKCRLCPHRCLIKEGKTGICRVRKNSCGTLYAESYGLCSAINLDPIEKKPLYHFYPGSRILSIGSVGCNFRCEFCQNYEIAQTGTEGYGLHKRFTPREITGLALENEYQGNIGLAYTYNEPFVGFEFMRDTAIEAAGLGMKNVVVSNGYVSKEPLLEILPYIDAFNIDLKAYTENFYRKTAGGRLNEVKETLNTIKKGGKHLEITTLVIPGLNDSSEEIAEMAEYIDNELGNDTVLHLSAYHPSYKMNIEPTPVETLKRLWEVAAKRLKYVYIGNIPEKSFQDTICPKCRKHVIIRSGHNVRKDGIDDDGKCKYCGYNMDVSV